MYVEAKEIKNLTHRNRKVLRSLDENGSKS